MAAEGKSRRGVNLALAAFLAIAALLLLGEHRVHALGAWPWLLLAACLLLHRYLHRGPRPPEGDRR